MSDLPQVIAENITLAVDADSCNPMTIELAVELAVAVKGKLQGLFIENVDLLSTARLPFSCEIMLSTGQRRVLNPDQLRSSYRRLASQFHQLLAIKAEQSVVQYNFNSLPGRRSDLMAQHAEKGYLILERSARKPLWHNRTELPKKSILVVNGHSKERLNLFLKFLGQKFKPQSLEIYWLENLSETSNQPSNPPQSPIHRIESDQVETLLHSRLDYIVIARSIESELFNKLVMESSCPIIVVD